MPNYDSSGLSCSDPPKAVGLGEIFLSKSNTLPRTLPGVEKVGQYRSVEGAESRDVVNYRVGRYSGFDPNGSPAAGTLTELANTSQLHYDDMAWAGLPMGWYAYGP